MTDFWITPGSLLHSKDVVIGSGSDFNQHIEKDELLLFLERKPHPSMDGLFIYVYVQGHRKSCVICPEEKFYRFFDIVYLGKTAAKNGTQD